MVDSNHVYIVCRFLQHVADFVAGCKQFGDVTEARTLYILAEKVGGV